MIYFLLVLLVFYLGGLFGSFKSYDAKTQKLLKKSLLWPVDTYEAVRLLMRERKRRPDDFPF